MDNKYIIFTKPHLKHLLFLLFFLISSIKKNIQSYFSKYSQTSVEFLGLYLFNLGDFISIIPYCIVRKRMKKEKNIITRNNNTIVGNIDNLYIKNTEKANEYNGSAFKLILVITLSDFTSQISSLIFQVIKQEKKIEVKLTILFQIIYNEY